MLRSDLITNTIEASERLNANAETINKEAYKGFPGIETSVIQDAREMLEQAAMKISLARQILTK